MLAVICMAIAASGDPQKSGKNEHPKSENSPPSSVTIVDNSSRQTQANPPEDKSPESHTGIEWANWALVLIGAITFGAVWKQTKESSKATNAMRDSVRLQEKAMEQWIELSNWRSQLASVPLRNSPFQCLLVKVDIVNKTSFPVTLKRAEIDFINTGDKVKHTYSAGADTFLTPSAPHEVVIAAQVTEYQVFSVSAGRHRDSDRWALPSHRSTSKGGHPRSLWPAHLSGV